MSSRDYSPAKLKYYIINPDSYLLLYIIQNEQNCIYIIKMVPTVLHIYTYLFILAQNYIIFKISLCRFIIIFL